MNQNLSNWKHVNDACSCASSSSFSFPLLEARNVHAILVEICAIRANAKLLAHLSPHFILHCRWSFRYRNVGA